MAIKMVPNGFVVYDADSEEPLGYSVSFYRDGVTDGLRLHYDGADPEFGLTLDELRDVLKSMEDSHG